MTTQYFRITAYHEKENLSAIFDSYGMFEKLWQFSSYLIPKGFKIIEVSAEDKFLDGNIERVTEPEEKIFLRAVSKGKPLYKEYTLNGDTYQAVQVNEKTYIPDITKTI